MSNVGKTTRRESSASLRRKFVKLMFLAATSSLLPSPALAAPLDFDADGTSDRTVVAIESDGSLSWSTKGNSATVALGELGRTGDNLIPGPWVTAGTPLIGYIRASETSVTWSVLSGSGIQSVAYGTPSDTLIAGGDYNGDGVIDAAFTRASRSSLVWHLNTGLFSGGSEQSVTHGKKKNTAFFYNPGGAHDWLAVLAKPASGPLRMVIRNPLTGSKRQQARISRSLLNFARPVPLARSDGVDNLLFVQKGTSKTTAVVVGPRGSTIFRASIPEEVDVVVGEYLADPGEEFAFASSGGFVAYNPASKVSATLEAPSGIAVDEVNVNTFATSDDSGLPTPRDSCYEGDPTDGAKSGFIWKPASDTQFGSIVILPGIYKDKVRKVETTTTSGALIRALQFKGNANPDPGGAERPHYIDRAMQGREYRSTYGSIYVQAEFINGACMTYLIENPALRTD